MLQLRKTLTLGLFFAAFAGGCSLENTPSEQEAERGPIGKADALEGTCESRCDAPFSTEESCQCDEQCDEFGDCCADKAQVCESETPTGASCELNSDCQGGEFCDREPGCGTAGTCAPVPLDQPCAKVLTTYCDCEGNTEMSSDACVFEPMAHLGACEDAPTGGQQGDSCELNGDCDGGLFCDRDPGCGAPGICAPVPVGPICGQAITPYCDCEGNSQVSNNTCIFEPIAHIGECEAAPTSGQEGDSCELNGDCDSGLFCDRDPGCGAPGSCAPVPFGPICGQAITPYCDCEGNSQVSNNTCIFEPIAHHGECE